MKTKGFGRLIALVLCMAMAFSVTSTAFAAEPSDSAYYNIETENGVAIVSVDNALAGEPAIAPIYNNSISLNAGQGIMIPIGTLTAGQKVVLDAHWYYDNNKTIIPSIDVALPLSTQTTFPVHRITGNSDTFTFTVNSAGTFSLFIGNPSSSYDLIVDFSVTIIL